MTEQVMFEGFGAKRLVHGAWRQKSTETLLRCCVERWKTKQIASVGSEESS